MDRVVSEIQIWRGSVVMVMVVVMWGRAVAVAMGSMGIVRMGMRGWRVWAGGSEGSCLLCRGGLGGEF